MIKILANLGTKENFLNLMKNTYVHTKITYSILNGEKLETFPQRSIKTVRLSPSTTAFQYHTGSPTYCNKTRK